ncbi:MAG: type II toxin-antitoxin system RelE/ParE family toxin [Candidatus Omnitrophica bacterium]|nr:type II toxin-antitoxin system RelE/ParE family toxin [Candidatus Omnitrophota bacterium]
MFYLKTKYFTRWAGKEGIALPGKGKSGGARTILFYQKDRKLIFCFGFSKNQQENLSDVQLKALNKLSDSFQNINEEATKKDIKHNEFIRISGMEVQP